VEERETEGVWAQREGVWVQTGAQGGGVWNSDSTSACLEKSRAQLGLKTRFSYVGKLSELSAAEK